ncbi:flavonol synthase/flavanone 3-hydroxylase [Phalaenopsis equestris]|uniref:flavonol synthase/flavanone 3-hydroxylase n=1 Tax=Phalaenopsis equestris TaxID=78828 RepID=UPI0009E47B28|nr:flavonol synthase/flavanone 3-hydroxylase [Phalaenopsis equestris]
MELETQRVQSIASLHLDVIPPEFIRSEEEQPGLTTFRGPVPEIPVVDMGGGDEEKTAEEVAVAAEEWGIFQVVNHGVPVATVAALQRAGREFFELPQEEKEKYAMKEGRMEGYGTKLQKELAGKKAWVDFLFHNVWPPASVDFSVWPENPPDYRKVNEEYAQHLLTLVENLLKWLSKGLGLEGHVLKMALGGDEIEYLLKINYYPPCPRPDLALGVVAHTDLSAITILVPNEVPGLQVFRDDVWFDANYIPNALIIHIGDQLEILSNGKYKSVLHRTTVNKEKTRMSWPVFVSPPPEKIIGPLPELLDDENQAKFKSKKFKEYKYCKINKLPQ